MAFPFFFFFFCAPTLPAGADLLALYLALPLVDGCVGGQVSNSKAGALLMVINESEKNLPQEAGASWSET